MELNLPLISLDDFLQTDQGGFVEFLRYPELAEALIARQNFVVEGVCLNQVLNRIQVRLTTCVYVKRYHLDLWVDERELDIPEDSVEEFLEKEREFAARLSGAEIERGPSLSDDIIRYHSRFRPHEHAHYVFRWDER